VFYDTHINSDVFYDSHITSDMFYDTERIPTRLSWNSCVFLQSSRHHWLSNHVAWSPTSFEDVFVTTLKNNRKDQLNTISTFSFGRCLQIKKHIWKEFINCN